MLRYAIRALVTVKPIIIQNEEREQVLSLAKESAEELATVATEEVRCFIPSSKFCSLK